MLSLRGSLGALGLAMLALGCGSAGSDDSADADALGGANSGGDTASGGASGGSDSGGASTGGSGASGGAATGGASGGSGGSTGGSGGATGGTTGGGGGATGGTGGGETGGMGGVCGDDSCKTCADEPCQGQVKSLCIEAAEGFVCVCPAGTHDDGQGGCAVDEECLELTCGGHGSCSVAEGSVVCSCDPGYTGATCSVCDAASGYHDDGAGACTNDVCQPNPCPGAFATCTDVGGNPSCGCLSGYHIDGGACVIDETCSAGSCSGHGTCSVSGGVASCACDVGYVGESCDECDETLGYHDDGVGACTSDVCLPNPCTELNRGDCEATGGDPAIECTCDSGYHDDGQGSCTTDPCLPDPCKANNQACRDQNGAAECYTPACDDQNPCTTEALVDGKCQVSTLPNGTECSTDACLVGETCQSGSCGGGAARTCDDGKVCTDDSCDSSSGCVFTANDATVPTDQVGCTDDFCAGGVAFHVQSDAFCSDGAYCTGVEKCSPQAVGADAQGCIVTSVPVAPAADSVCRSYVCDEASDSFQQVSLDVGTSCNDYIPCTTNDACTASGVCLGTMTASCTIDGGACGTTTPFGSTIDYSRSDVAGSLELNGGLPGKSKSSNDVGFYAVSKTTGIEQLFATLQYDTSGNLVAGTDSYTSSLLPGVYDIVYQRAYNTTDGYVFQTASGDVFPNGYRRLLENVVLGPGSQTLNLNVDVAQLSGAIEMNGDVPPKSKSSNDVGFYARSHDTGKAHLFATLQYDTSGNLVAGTNAYSTILPVGTYDIEYQRGYNSSSDYVFQSSVGEAFPYGYQTLRKNVTLVKGAQTLDLDVSVGTVTGAIELNGGTPPTSKSSNDVAFYARSHDTGKLHGFATLQYDTAGLLVAGTDSYSTVLPVGTYDIEYQRGYNATNDYVFQSPANEPFSYGYQTLQKDVVIGLGSQVLDLDVSVGSVSGAIELNGGAPPASKSSNDVAFYARSHDTGKLHGFATLQYDTAGLLVAGTDSYSTVLPVGTYDVLYQRGYNSSEDYVFQNPANEPFSYGYQTLQKNVVIGPGSQVLDLNVGVGSVSGAIELNDGLPPKSKSSNDVGFYARSHDTGKLHWFATLQYDTSGNLVAGTDSYATVLPVGTYDVLYQRAYNSSGGYVYENPAGEPFSYGYQMLMENVSIGLGAQTLDLNVNVSQIVGTVTFNQGKPPPKSKSSNDPIIYALSRETGVLHWLTNVEYDTSGNLVAGTDSYSTALPAGTYDLVYQRSFNTSGNYVFATALSDVVPNGYNHIASCISVP